MLKFETLAAGVVKMEQGTDEASVLLSSPSSVYYECKMSWNCLMSFFL